MSTPTTKGGGQKYTQGTLFEDGLVTEVAKGTTLPLLKQNPREADAITHKYKREPAVSRIIAARGVVDSSELAELIIPQVTTLPTALILANLPEAGSHIYNKVRQGAEIKLTATESLSSLIGAATIADCLKELGIPFSYSVSPNSGASRSNLADNKSVMISTALNQGVQIDQIFLQGPASKNPVFGTPLITLYLTRELALQSGTREFRWQRFFDLTALAESSESLNFDELDPCTNTVCRLGALEATTGKRPFFLAVCPRLFVENVFTPTDLSEKIKPFLDKCLSNGFGAEIFSLLIERDIRNAEVIVERLVAKGMFPEARVGRDLRFDPVVATTIEPIADAQIELAEVNFKLEGQLRGLISLGAHFRNPSVILSALRINAVREKDTHRLLQLTDGAQAITAVVAVNQGQELKIDDIVNVKGELKLSVLPRKEVYLVVHNFEKAEVLSTPALDPSSHLSSSLRNPPLKREIAFIRADQDITPVIKELSSARRLAIDLETTLTEPRIPCTLQITDPEGDRNYVIDLIKERKLDGTVILRDLNPFRSLLENPKIIKLIFNEQFERGVFKDQGILCRSVRDVMKILKVIRPDIERRSFKVALRFCLGINISKEEAVSDWTARLPDGTLPENQLRYAATDTERLVDLDDYFNDLLSCTTVDPKWTVAQLMEMGNHRLKALNGIIDLTCPDYFYLERKAELLKSRVKELLDQGHLPVMDPLGIARSGDRFSAVLSSEFEAAFRESCREDVPEHEIESALQTVISERVTRAEAMRLLKQPEYAPLNFLSDKEIDIFLSDLTDAVPQPDRSKIEFKFKPSRVVVDFRIDPKWSIVRCMEELNRTTIELLEIKRQQPVIVEGQLLLRRISAQIEYLFSMGASSYRGKSGVAEPFTYQVINAQRFQSAFREKAEGLLSPELIEETVSKLIERRVSSVLLKRVLERPVFEDTPLYALERQLELLASVSAPLPGYKSAVVLAGLQ